MKNFKYLWITLSILILSACGQSEVESNSESLNETEEEMIASQNLSTPPVSVQTGFISSDYHFLITDIIEKHSDFIDILPTYAKSENKTDEVKDAMLKAHTDFLLYIKAINIEPTKEVDHLVHDNFESLLYHIENYLNYSIEYVSTEDDVLLNLSSDEMSDADVDIVFIESVFEKYNIEL